MVLSWILCGMFLISALCAAITGRGSELAASVPAGAQAGVTLSISIAGSLCLWTGIGKLMEHAGLTAVFSRLLSPLLYRVFPGTKSDANLSEALSGNICANFLGLGNAATPMGIRSVELMARRAGPGTATDEMCRLIVLNTASIQLIPANVAAVRASLGCVSPFDILPAVWVSSICSAGLGVAAAWLLGKVWQHD